MNGRIRIVAALWVLAIVAGAVFLHLRGDTSVETPSVAALASGADTVPQSQPRRAEPANPGDGTMPGGGEVRPADVPQTQDDFDLSGEPMADPNPPARPR